MPPASISLRTYPMQHLDPTSLPLQQTDWYKLHSISIAQSNPLQIRLGWFTHSTSAENFVLPSFSSRRTDWLEWASFLTVMHHNNLDRNQTADDALKRSTHALHSNDRLVEVSPSNSTASQVGLWSGTVRVKERHWRHLSERERFCWNWSHAGGRGWPLGLRHSSLVATTARRSLPYLCERSLR